MTRAVVVIVLLAPALARAQDLRDRFNIRLALTAGYLTEQQGEPDPAKAQAAPFSLAYGDLRAIIDARRLPGKFELHLDGRARLTGEFNQRAAFDQGNQQWTARGYLGGREYELREAYVRRRGQKLDFALGRMFVVEADALKLDGLRFWYRFGKHWDGSVFAGGYPNPYSRSLTTDYQGSAGYYGVSVAGGANVSYTYDKVWGYASAVAAYLGGFNDGGPLVLATPTGTRTVEGVRSYLTWTSMERFATWLDLYHNLVLDVAGAAGVQLTRLNVFATARAGRFVTLRLGYDHMSSIAIEMFLANLLTNRGSLATITSITNNLIVERTARDEARGSVNVHFGKVNLFGEGRLRLRSLVNAGEDPQFAAPGYSTPSLAYDTTFGVRDLGSLKGIRLGLYYIYWSQFRSQHHIVGAELGRSFLDERLTIDLTFLYADSRDVGASAVSTTTPNPCPPTLYQPNPTALIVGCYGIRDGASYETALTITGNPSKRWFLMFDYRLVASTTDALAPNPGRATLLTHVLVLRIEARY